MISGQGHLHRALSTQLLSRWACPRQGPAESYRKCHWQCRSLPMHQALGAHTPSGEPGSALSDRQYHSKGSNRTMGLWGSHSQRTAGSAQVPTTPGALQGPEQTQEPPWASVSSLIQQKPWDFCPPFGTFHSDPLIMETLRESRLKKVSPPLSPLPVASGSCSLRGLSLGSEPSEDSCFTPSPTLSQRAATRGVWGPHGGGTKCLKCSLCR